MTRAKRVGMGGNSRLAACTAVIGVCLGTAGAAGVAAARTEPSARAARTISLSESAQLHRTSGRGITINGQLNEMGAASGTIRGTIYIHLKFPAIDRVTAEVNIYTSGGSISGNASASYRVAGGTASFSGTMSVSRGSGSYGGAHASGLSFTGTVQRSNDAVGVRLRGELST